MGVNIPLFQKIGNGKFREGKDEKGNIGLHLQVLIINYIQELKITSWK
jgi:hypothetical protein